MCNNVLCRTESCNVSCNDGFVTLSLDPRCGTSSTYPCICLIFLLVSHQFTSCSLRSHWQGTNCQSIFHISENEEKKYDDKFLSNLKLPMTICQWSPQKKNYIVATVLITMLCRFPEKSLKSKFIFFSPPQLFKGTFCSYLNSVKQYSD